jgi:hypothetical protein
MKFVMKDWVWKHVDKWKMKLVLFQKVNVLLFHLHNINVVQYIINLVAFILVLIVYGMMKKDVKILLNL